MVTRRCVTRLVCSGVGVVFLVTGCVLIKVFNDLIHSEVNKQIPLKEGSEAYKRWQAPKSPIWLQVWMFDVVNYEEVLKGDKPTVVQMGPYTYKGIRERFNISFHENGTITYRTKRTYYFQPDKSVGSDNDTFHCVNLPYLTIASITRWESKTFKEMVNAALELTGETLFLKLSVRELMWGYEVNLLKAINTLAKEFHLNFTISDKFGLFADQNASDNGLFNMYSGVKGLDDFAYIVSWNGLSALEYWTNSSANMINGSEGIMYPPFINESTKYLFSSDLCRSIRMEYREGVTVQGINLDKFIAPVNLLANAHIDPSNAGFCVPHGHCLPSGFLNISVCREGAPVIMSMPHFLGCDKDILNSVVGLHPQQDEHESFLSIEPLTGVTMHVGKKLQVNTYIEQIEGFWDTYDVTPVYLPVMWMNESAIVSESDANEFSSKVYDKITLTKAVQYCLIAIGSFLLACVILTLLKQKLFPQTSNPGAHDDDTEPLLHEATSTRHR